VTTRLRCGTISLDLGVSPDARVPVPTETFYSGSNEGRIMAVWAWILLVGGVVGMLGAALICAFMYECTSMMFRRWNALP
jgi:hypothetical protein